MSSNHTIQFVDLTRASNSSTRTTPLTGVLLPFPRTFSFFIRRSAFIRDCTSENRYSRTRRPTRYLLIDFGLSHRYDVPMGHHLKNHCVAVTRPPQSTGT